MRQSRSRKHLKFLKSNSGPHFSVIEQSSQPDVTTSHLRSAWPFLTGCLLLVLIGTGFSAWQFETPIHKTLIHSESGLALDGVAWWACFLTVWGKSLWLALPILITALSMRLMGRIRVSAAFFDVSVALLAFWLVMDLYLMTLTRTHVTDYLGFALDRSAWEWAGRSSEVLSRLALLFGVILFAVTLVCIPVGILVRRTAHHFNPVRMKRPAILLGAVYVCVLSGSATTLCSPGQLSLSFMPTLRGQLPLRFAEDSSIDETSATGAQNAALQASFQAAYADVFPELIEGRELDDSIVVPEGNRKDVVIFVLESLRHDALIPETMPMLCGLSETGLVCEQHYAGANASHFGLFSLLYGRSALVYESTLDADIPPQLCATLRDSNYELSFVSSGNCDEWQRMGEYLNDSVFDRVENQDADSWVERDRAALSRVSELLTEPDRTRPRLVVAFLMSTHFNYEFPPAFAIHEPYARDVSLFTLGQRDGLWNRYRNAAGFLDHEVARTIGQLDLDRTVVVVTGDHGESLLDDGQMFHGSRLSEIQTRVPCMLLGTGVPRGTIPAMTSHMDLAPTLMEALCGLPTQIAHAHGRSFLTDSSQSPRDVLLVQPPFGTQRDPAYREAALFTNDLRVRFRLSRREPAVLDVRVIDERGQSLSSQTLDERGLADLERAFRDQMNQLRPPGGRLVVADEIESHALIQAANP